MRLAVLLEPVLEGRALELDSLVRSLAHRPRIALLPSEDPLTREILRAVQPEAQSEGDVQVLYVAGEAVRAEMWAAGGFEADGFQLAPRSDEAVEAAIAHAAGYREAGDPDGARAAYEAADRLMAEEISPRRAEVLTCLAELERQLGREQRAVELLDRALAIFPSHRGALMARILMAREQRDAVTLGALLHRMIRFAESDDEKVATLESVADAALVAVGDAIEEAIRVRPGDSRLLQRLRAAREAAGRWKDAVDAGVALAESLRVPEERARALVTAAELCAQRAGNVDRAVALYEAAIADDPAVPGAFEAIEDVLVRSADYPGLERAYERQLERLAGRGADAAELVLLDKLSRLREDKLGDLTGAIQALDRLVVRTPRDVGPRLRLAKLLEDARQDDLAMRSLEVAALVAPTSAAVFQSMHRVASRTGDLDRSYCACAALVHLGEADLDEQMAYQQFAPETALKPYRPLDDASWDLLVSPDHDESVAAVLQCIEPVAVASRLEEMRTTGRFPQLDPKDRHDPATTTLSAVRAVAWAAGLLGVPVPQIYARAEEIPGGIATVATGAPTLFLGKAALVGRTIPELAFMAARELAYLRLTGRLPAFWPSLRELKVLATAAISLALGGAGRTRESASLERALGAKLDPPRKAALEAAVRRLTDTGAQLDLARWTRTVEISACRAGLLACEDVTVAARMLAVEGRVRGGLLAADKIKDLVGFSVSQKHAALRTLAGLAVLRAPGERIAPSVSRVPPGR
jgi:tetratricopeptide (TPR) repeat protein